MNYLPLVAILIFLAAMIFYEMFNSVIILVVSAILIVLIIAIYFFGYKKKTESSKNQVLEEKEIKNTIKEDKIEKEKIIETKTISYIDSNGSEREISLDIVENNGGIKKISEDSWGLFQDIYNDTGSICYMAENKKELTVACLDSNHVGSFFVAVNKNHFCILEDEYGKDEYYININDIAKIIITLVRGYDINSKSLENYDKEGEIPIDYSNQPRINLCVQTTSGSTFDKLDFPTIEKDDVKNLLNVIKKVNNNILFEYNYTIFMTDPKYNMFEYSFDKNLRINEYTYKHESICNEFVINYSDIIDSNIINYDTSGLCAVINVKPEKQYKLIFAKDEDAVDFYNELKKHINK